MTKLFDVQKSDAFRRLCETERVAQRSFYNSPLHLPGPFQVPAYAEEMICGISGLSVSDQEAVERIRVRNERHAAFIERLHGGDPPQVQAVIDEAVLRRAPVGSDAMRRQIEHLIELSRKPTVDIGIIPMDHGPHQGLAGSFEVYDTARDSLVFFEGGEGDRILDDDTDRIALYRSLVSSLMDIAASDEAARTLMGKLINA